MSADKNEVIPEVEAQFEDENPDDLAGEPVDDPTIAEEDK